MAKVVRVNLSSLLKVVCDKKMFCPILDKGLFTVNLSLEQALDLLQAVVKLSEYPQLQSYKRILIFGKQLEIS